MKYVIIFFIFIMGSISQVKAKNIETMSDDNKLITCSSKNWMRKECKIDASVSVSLKKRLSRYSCQGNWGYTHKMIWVAKGCSALFDLSGNTDQSKYPPQNSNFICTSKNSRRKSCPIETGVKVKMTKQLSSVSCENNWGQTRREVWVIQGCSAEFSVQ